MNDPSEQSSSDYRILKELGQGIHGHVYKAWHTAQQRVVALKLLKPQVTGTAFHTHCLPTVNSLTSCSHPNICSVSGIDKAGESYTIIMEYVEGTTLRELIKSNPLDNHIFLSIAAQIADGLKYAHEHGITHGNIKPSNILVTGNRQPKITDFGLTYYPQTTEAGSATLPLEALPYLAPEQLAGESATPLADLFSLGTVFYELLTGRRPFTGETPEAVINSILNDTPDFENLRAREIPGDTILMIEKLLAKDPSDRFSSAEELAITLHAMRSFERESAVRQFLQVKPQTPRQYLLISLLAVLLVALWYVMTTYHN